MYKYKVVDNENTQVKYKDLKIVPKYNTWVNVSYVPPPRANRSENHK